MGHKVMRDDLALEVQHFVHLGHTGISWNRNTRQRSFDKVPVDNMNVLYCL